MKLRMTLTIAAIFTITCPIMVLADMPQTQTGSQTQPDNSGNLAWDKLTWEEIGQLLAKSVNALQEKEAANGWPESAAIRVGMNEEVIVMIVAVLKNDAEFRNVPIYLLERKSWHPGDTFAEIMKSAEAYRKFCEQVREAQAQSKLYSPAQSEFTCPEQEESLVVSLQKALSADKTEIPKWRQLEPQIIGLTFITLLLDGEKRFMVHVVILNPWGLEDYWLAASYSLPELKQKDMAAVVDEIHQKIIDFLARKDYLQRQQELF